MKPMIKITALVMILAMVFSVHSANAQRGEMRVNLYYNYAKPMGNFKDEAISNGSPRGGGGDLMYGVSRQWSVGLSAAFQDYYQKYPRGIYSLDKNQDISAVLTNSIQTTPIMAKASFSPLGNKRGPVQPYISAGAGVNLVNYRQYLGQFESSDASAGFIAQIGAGVQIPFGRLSSSGILVGANYNYAPYHKNGLTNLNTLDFRAGVYLPLR